MFKAWQNFWDQFLNNEAYFIARIRSLVALLSMSAAIEGKRIALLLGRPWIETVGELLGIAGMAASFLMRAGDKTPQNVKDLADAITPPQGVPPAPPRGFAQVWVLVICAIVASLGLALVWNLHARRYDAAMREAESARLKLAGHIVADEDTKAAMQATVAGLTTDNARLKDLYEKARADSPGSQVEGVAQLSTGQVIAHGTTRSTGTPLPGHAPADTAPAVSNPPPEPGGHSGEGSTAEGGLKFDQATFPPGCLLAEGDTAELRVKLIDLKTKESNRVFVGTAETWRTKPAPASLIVQSEFTAQLSTVEVPEVAPESRWSGGAVGLCGAAGCALGPQVAYIVPVFSVRVQATVGAAFGPPGVYLLAGLTLRR